MKDDITRSNKFLAFKIVNSVTLLPKRIANEDATSGTTIKFVGGGEVGGITEATENSKMRVGRWVVV